MTFHLPPPRLMIYAALIVVCAAVFSATGSAAEKSRELPAPTGLQTFLRAANTSRTPTSSVKVPTFPRTPAFAWNPVRGATGYQFQLSTREDFLADNSLVWASNVTTPAASMRLALPWITGEPASLFWRVRSLGPAGLSQWSSPRAFDMRWTQRPHALPASAGFVRWSTVEGATGYEVWFLNTPSGRKTFSTITNVADEREYYVAGRQPSVPVLWRVRAARQASRHMKNGLPSVSYGPWSRIFRATDPAKAPAARIRPLQAVSDVVSTSAHPKPHTLVPALTVNGAPTTPGNLYRVYLFTDRDCVNRVFTGYPVSSPAYAPRSYGGQALAEGKQLMADGTEVKPTELVHVGTGPAKIDLWDTTGRYYAVAVPVVVARGTPAASEAAPTGAPQTGTPQTSAPQTVTTQTVTTQTVTTQTVTTQTGTPQTGTPQTGTPQTGSSPDAAGASSIVYQDVELPQDACAAGRVLTFGKASRTPILTSGGHPTATGLSPNGRLLAAVTWKPRFFGSPLVTWDPASGAVAYQVQWSRSNYPWRPAGSMRTAATSAVLRLTPGAWWYRVRGINSSLRGSQLMSWSAQVPIVVTQPTFSVTATPTPAKRG